MKRLAMVCVAAAALSFGCAGAPVQETGAAGGKGAASVTVPLSAIPQPGQCLIWSPAAPEQSTKGICSELIGKVKAGEWVITRGQKNSEDIQAFVYGELGVLRETYLLDAATGKSK